MISVKEPRDTLSEGNGDPIRIPRDANTGTETIDLGSLSGVDLTQSGSFDLTGLKKSFFGKLLQCLPIPAFVIDQRLSIVFANAAYSNIHRGYEGIQDRPFSSLFVSAFAGKEVESVLKRVLFSRKPDTQTAMLQIGNSQIWGRMSFRPVRIREYRAVLVLIEHLTLEKKQLHLAQKHQEELEREIRDRKAKEKELRKSEERCRNIIETIQDGYYETDLAGNVTLFSDNFCALTGYSRQELATMSYWRLMDREDVSRTLDELKGAHGTGKPTKVFDHEIMRKDGTKRNLATSISLIRDPSGRPSGFRGICRDITERKQAADDRVRIEKLESIGILAGGIAHDFNNILTSILGNLSLARISQESPDEVTRRLEEAEKAVTRARGLTQQLLTFSRGGSPTKRTASILELIGDSCEFALRGTSVRCQFSALEDIYPVEVDAVQISQVISNLMINAEQAMPDGGVIAVRLENVSRSAEDGLPLRDGKYVKISVRDQGSGIPARILTKIFDPYFTTKQQGSGLGLATAYSIVKNHEGLITVESEAGVGTTFHIFLPASEKAMVKGKGSDRRMVTGDGRILLMDDEEPIRSMAREMLSMLGYEVDVAKNGEEAIGLYRAAKDSESPYTAVILDLTVPGGMGGKEALHKLLEMDPDVRAIVSSGYSSDPIMSQYQRYGLSAVVAKPYSIEELSQALNRVIIGERESLGD